MSSATTNSEPRSQSLPRNDQRTKDISIEEKQRADVEHHGPIPPDGGSRAWACVLGSFLLQFCSFGYVNACGIFQYHYQAVLLKDESSSSLAWITTLQIFLLFMFGPAIGLMVDAYGARKIIAPFSVLTIFSVCMLSICTKYWQVMLVQGVVFGLASSGLSMPAFVLATQWFSSKKGVATGIVSAGGSLGGVLYPFMIPELIRKVGFASAVRWTALMQGILLVIANLLCTSPFPPRGFQKRESAGLKAFKSWPWGFFVLGCFFVMWGLFAPLNYLPEFAASHGMGVQLAQYTVGIGNAGSLLGRIIPGYASDRLGQFNIMVLVSTLSGVLTIAFWLPLETNPSNTGIIVFSLLFGFVSGGFVSLGPPCIVCLADDKVDEIGAKLGGFCLAVAFGALTGLPIEGAIKDRQGDRFTGLMAFSGSVMVVGGMLMGAVRVLKGGWDVKKRV